MNQKLELKETDDPNLFKTIINGEFEGFSYLSFENQEENNAE